MREHDFEEHDDYKELRRETPRRRGVSILTLIFITVICCLITFAATFFGMQSFFNNNFAMITSRTAEYSELFELDNIVKSEFAFEIDDEQLMDGLLSGYVAGLDDPYSYYLTAEMFDNAQMDLQGEFVGIGIMVTFDHETELIRVTSAMKNSPAQAAGIQPGDLIYKVGDVEVLEIGYDAAVINMLGEEGTEAIFSIYRGEQFEEIDFNITRSRFEEESVSYEMLEDNLGYIEIYEFDTATVDQFDLAVNDLINMGAVGLIFDVRNNPGGELESICTILDSLVPEGTIIEIVGKGGEIVDSRESRPDELNIPMAVLINGQTYSAAELFAATLRDYDKATLVGETTFGKGSMQSTIPLRDGSAVNLTVNLYNPPNGENYHGIGVEPHIEAILPEELEPRALYLTLEEDLQLQKAIEVLKGQ